MKSLRHSRVNQKGTWMVACVCVLAVGSAIAGIDRITGPIDHFNAVRVQGNLNPLARSEFDQGAVAPGFLLRGMTVMVRRTAAQQKELDQLLAAQHDPASPEYHKWLTPEQFGERFGASENDLATLRQWLESKGLQIKAVARSRTFVRFDATAEQVRNAFGTEIHYYTVNGVKHYANASEPSLPENLAPLVASVGGMNDFRPHPTSVKIPRSKAAATPQYLDGNSNNDLAPGDLATIYDISNPGTGGLGQTVVVIGASDVASSDVQGYCAAFLASAPCANPSYTVTEFTPDGDPGTQEGWAMEATMDLELVSAVAPNATVVLDADATLWNAVLDAVDHTRGQVISMSFGTCEADITPSATYEATVQQANASGITMVASSGDSGGTACVNPGTATSSITAAPALGVNWPASIPEVTAVGGTEFNEGESSYWGATNSGSGGTAVSYIPETTWNDTLAMNMVMASGGGMSTLYAKPLWQAGTGVPADGQRDVPDVALAASFMHDGYVIYLDGTLSTASTDPGPYTAGGTSASAQVFAGMVALLNASQSPTGSGNINPSLYTIAGGITGYSAVQPAFHDITTGNNQIPWNDGQGDSGVVGYFAALGYDQATGLGSVDFNQLELAWGAARDSITNLSPSSVDAGAAGFTLTVTGSGFMPNAVVEWNSTPLTTTFVSATELTAPILQSMVAAAGSPTVAVQNADGTSASTTFTINAPPTITSLSPDTATAGSSSFLLTVNGTGFVSGAHIVWGSTPLVTTVVSGTQLTATVTLAMLAEAGTVPVQVVNGDLSVTAPSAFVITGTGAITGFSPRSAVAGGSGFTLTVNGTGFVSGAIVLWNSTPLATTVASGTALTVPVTAGMIASSGPVEIMVINGDHIASLPATFNVWPSATATITNLSPSSAVAGAPAFTLAVNGNGFVSGATIAWNGTRLATTFSSSQLTAQISAAMIASGGIVPVTVINGDKTVSAASNFTITAPTATITYLSPRSATAGGAGFTLTVNGTGFVTGATIDWNGTPLTTAFSSSTKLTAPVTSAMINSPATVQVTVVNADTTVSLPHNFTISGPSATITNFSPGSATAGGAAFTLTVIGTGFASGATVTWNGTRLSTTFGSDTQLTAPVTAAMIATGGTVPITVINADKTVSLPLNYTITTPSATITSLSPHSATAGGAGFTLTVNGTGFVTGATVDWNGSPLLTSFANSTQLSASVSSALIASAGTAQVTVVNEDTTVSLPHSFTISGATATISSFSPASAIAGGAAFTLTVNGNGFASGATVTWNKTRLNTTFVDANHLTAPVSAAMIATGGTVPITVINADKTVSLPVNYTITTPSATITSLSPRSATAGGAQFTLTVNGTGFVTGAKIVWAGSNQTTAFVSSTQLTATVTTTMIASAGTVPVQVLNNDTTLSLPYNFTINSASATISSLSPSSALAGGAAFTLTVNGSGFVNGAKVKWNLTSLTTTFVNATQLTAPVTAAMIASAGPIPVTVENADKTVSLPSNFTVSTPTAAITSLVPAATIAAGAGFNLTVYGTGFASGDQVAWNGTPLTTNAAPDFSSLTAPITQAMIATAATPQITIVSGSGTVLSVPVNYRISPVPTATISSLSPSSIAASNSASTFTLTVNGTNFYSGSTVTWTAVSGPGEGTNPLLTTLVSATQLTAQVPANYVNVASQGSAQVKVVNGLSGTKTTSAAKTFSIPPTATITSISPTGAVAGGSSAVALTVNGTGFVSGATIDWNGVALVTHFTSATKLTASIPAVDINNAASAGMAAITVVNKDTTTSAVTNFTIYTSNITVSPTSAVAGAAGPLTLTVTGTGFTSGTTVYWGGTALTTAATTPGSTTSLTATVTTAELAASGTVNVVAETVSGSGPSQVTLYSTAATFTLNAPSITSISPTSAPAGTASTIGSPYALTVNGTNFVSGSTVYWGTTALTMSGTCSAVKCIATVTAAELATPGAVNVTVQNGSSSAVSGTKAFTVNAPAISSISPASAPAGTTSTEGSPYTLTVNGTNFVAGSTVYWNGTALTTAACTAIKCTATVTTADMAAAGTASVTVQNTGNANSASGTKTFTINAPTITTVAPTSATHGNSISLTVNGTNFVPGSVICWGPCTTGVKLTTTVTGSIKLTATVTAGQNAEAGQVSIYVWNDASAISAAKSFTVN